MYNQKIIKKIKRCAKEGSYDELLNYIKEAIDLEDLFALREHKIIEFIVDNTNGLWMLSYEGSRKEKYHE